MAKYTPYFEKLRDPRWQKKRLEILQRAEWKCEHCGNSEEILHVHHGYYQRGLDPWDYDNATLHCFCEQCHLDAQDMLGDLHFCIAHMSFAELEAATFNAIFDLADKQQQNPKERTADAT